MTLIIDRENDGVRDEDGTVIGILDDPHTANPIRHETE